VRRTRTPTFADNIKYCGDVCLTEGGTCGAFYKHSAMLEVDKIRWDI